MKTETATAQAIESFQIAKEIEIDAPIEIAFEATIDQLGAECEMPGGKPFPMTFEARPGGRWFRDLGNDAGHFWGHVQVIKPPTLIEICGPLMMSVPAINHLQYRLKAEGDRTLLSLTHRSVGLIQPEHRDGLLQGWTYWIDRIRDLAQSKSSAGKK